MENIGELVDQFEKELGILFEKANRSGVSYWQILMLMPDILKRLLELAAAEYWQKKCGKQ